MIRNYVMFIFGPCCCGCVSVCLKKRKGKQKEKKRKAKGKTGGNPHYSPPSIVSIVSRGEFRNQDPTLRKTYGTSSNPPSSGAWIPPPNSMAHRAFCAPRRAREKPWADSWAPDQWPPPKTFPLPPKSNIFKTTQKH